MGFQDDYIIVHPDGKLVLDWRRVPSLSCTADEINRRIHQLESEAADKKLAHSSFRDGMWGGARRLSVFLGSWYVKATKYYTIVFDCTMKIEKNPVKYYFSINKNTKNQDAVENEATGYRCWCALNQHFKQKRGTKTVTIRSAFSDPKHKQEYLDVKKCVPKQVQYCAQGAINKKIDHAYKADISSAFPSNIVGKKLPTLRGCKRVNGFAEPTDEYPFAFYLKSHHLSIKDEFSTWDDLPMMKLFYKEMDSVYTREKPNRKDEITILCREAKLKDEKALWDSYQALYDGRKEDPDFKSMMVISIGYFHLNADPFCSPLAAVTIARTNHRIFGICRDLMRSNNLIALVATDSVAWKGTAYKGATDEKFLGSFTYECYDSSLLVQGCKNYQYISRSGTCVTKCAGVKREISSTWKFGEIPLTHKEKKMLMINQITGEVITV